MAFTPRDIGLSAEEVEALLCKLTGDASGYQKLYNEASKSTSAMADR
jgi:hypothetical protein